MIQFTEKQKNLLQEKCRKQPWILEMIKNRTELLEHTPLMIPETGIGNWSMYYFCEKCSVPLTFCYQKQDLHQCPSCGRVYHGEPYNGSWWGKVNDTNSRLARDFGKEYLLTGDKKAADMALRILDGYAAVYPGYEPHGDIPYNGPGKANAQTLDEAVFLMNLAFAYDLVKEAASPEEQKRIETGLFYEGMEFLLKHRRPQLHNHEVIANSALGILGILLDKPEAVHKAVYEPYGLIYQLEHGMGEDHLWFEGTFGYHFYALKHFMEYEKFALHTPYSNIHHPNYQNMFEAVLNYVRENGNFLRANDIYIGHKGLFEMFIYEFIYPYMATDRIKQIMGLFYQKQERRNEEAFFYGADTIERLPFQPETSHPPKGIGYTVFRGKSERFLSCRHGAFGGEHDHYDMLGISYHSHGADVIPDLGTTGYGAPLHYGYYKNTASHNTVSIDGKNQPPVLGKAVRFETIDGITYLETEADWRIPCPMPDSYTIVQWDEKAYSRVSMKRKIAWADDYWADLFLVEGAGEKDIEYILHIAGNRKKRDGEENQLCGQAYSAEKPLSYVMQTGLEAKHGTVKNSFEIRSRQDLMLDVYTWYDQGRLCYGRGPDNPSDRELEYMIWRKNGNRAVFFNVMQSRAVSDDTDRIRKLTFFVNQDRASVKIKTDKKATEIVFSF